MPRPRAMSLFEPNYNSTKNNFRDSDEEEEDDELEEHHTSDYFLQLAQAISEQIKEKGLEESLYKSSYNRRFNWKSIASSIGGNISEAKLKNDANRLHSLTQKSRTCLGVVTDAIAYCKNHIITDTEMPRRPPNSFLLYHHSLREKLGNNAPSASKCGEMWKQLSPEKRAPYEEAFRKEYEKYLIEKSLYDKAVVLKKKPDAPVAKIKAPAVKIKAPAAKIKTPAYQKLTPYRYFANEMTREGQITENLQTQWSNLPIKDKVKFILAAFQANGTEYVTKKEIEMMDEFNGKPKKLYSKPVDLFYKENFATLTEIEALPRYREAVKQFNSLDKDTQDDYIARFNKYKRKYDKQLEIYQEQFPDSGMPSKSSVIKRLASEEPISSSESPKKPKLMSPHKISTDIKMNGVQEDEPERDLEAEEKLKLIRPASTLYNHYLTSHYSGSKMKTKSVKKTWRKLDIESQREISHQYKKLVKKFNKKLNKYLTKIQDDDTRVLVKMQLTKGEEDMDFSDLEVPEEEQLSTDVS